MLNVVAGIILNKEDKIYICERPLGKSLGDYFEFPGGKVEAGESYEVALKRELEEELSAKIEVLDLFDEYVHDYETFSINLICFKCRLLSDACHSLEHTDEAWVSVDEFKDYKMAPADLKVIEKLRLNI